MGIEERRLQPQEEIMSAMMHDLTTSFEVFFSLKFIAEA
jgi:hypothetical protein